VPASAVASTMRRRGAPRIRSPARRASVPPDPPPHRSQPSLGGLSASGTTRACAPESKNVEDRRDNVTPRTEKSKQPRTAAEWAEFEKDMNTLGAMFGRK
jgi:hypothetical protein